MHSSKIPILPQSPPLLSVVVPILNEASGLGELFAVLNEQEQIALEVILVDGGSSDDSPAIARALAAKATFPCTLLGTRPGRGRQMNAGARVARGDFLLFLHADSAFAQKDALAQGVTRLRQAWSGSPGTLIAGRFTLLFERSSSAPSFLFNFQEAKARQNRHGCIHGDQGFFLDRAAFLSVGPFDESLPFLEDDRLAAKIFKIGAWLSFPAAIITSPRRFAREGGRQRQILNLLILVLDALNEKELLSRLPDLYRPQGESHPLGLGPVCSAIALHLAALPRVERQDFWRRAGSCLRANLWQLFLALDLCRKRSSPPGAEAPSGSWLSAYDRYFASRLGAPHCHPLATLLARTIFWLLAFYGRFGKSSRNRS